MRNLVWALIFGVVLMANISVAVDYKFKNTTGDGKWETQGNWSPVGNPGPLDQVRFGETSTTIVGTLSTVSAVLRLQIGVDNNGYCVIDGGALTTTGSWNGLGAGNGFGPGKTASLTIKGNGSLTVGSPWRMGVSGPGGAKVILTMTSGTLTTPGFEQNYAPMVDATTRLEGGTLVVNGALLVTQGTIIMAGGKIIVTGDQVAYVNGLIAAGRMVLGSNFPAGEYYIEATFDSVAGTTTIMAAPEPANIPLLGLGILTSP